MLFASAFIVTAALSFSSFASRVKSSGCRRFWDSARFQSLAVMQSTSPSLYPTRLRSSGVGFCYNVGRVITAVALFGSAYLVEMLKGYGVAEPFRVGSILIAGIYFLGIIALIWAPGNQRPSTA